MLHTTENIPTYIFEWSWKDRMTSWPIFRRQPLSINKSWRNWRTRTALLTDSTKKKSRLDKYWAIVEKNTLCYRAYCKRVFGLVLRVFFNAARCEYKANSGRGQINTTNVVKNKLFNSAIIRLNVFVVIRRALFACKAHIGLR